MWAQCRQELPKTCPRAAQELPSSCPGASWELSRGAQEQMQARTIRQFSERRGTTCPAGQPASQPAPAEGWVKRGGGGRWGRELGRREKGERREGVRTNNSVLGGHPDTRAESMISTSLEQISAAQRIDGLPWVDLGVGGWPAERQQSVWETNMHQTCAPLARKCVKNAYP